MMDSGSASRLHTVWAPQYFRSPHQRALNRQGPCLLYLGGILTSLPAETKLLDHKLTSGEMLISLKFLEAEITPPLLSKQHLP